MQWLLVLAASGGCIFDLFFLGAMHRELQREKSTAAMLVSPKAPRRERYGLADLRRVN